jgi:hypothetical protein
MLIALAPISARGQDTNANTEALGVVFTVRAVLETCDFPATPSDMERLEDHESRLIAALQWDDETVNRFYTDVEARLAARSWDKLCADPTYKTQILDTLRGLHRR